MIKSKKQMFMIITSFILIMLLTTVTYAFFNYTRTGVANRIQVGRIYFNSEQTSINLTNAFPIDREDLANSEYVGETTIHITGDTTYSEGIEYLITAVDVNNTIGTGYNAKQIPISVDLSYNETDNKTIGANDRIYFDHRGGSDSLYKILAGDIIYENAIFAVGYIAPNQTGIDGTITIKAFIDKDRIAISDTYPSSSLKYWYNTEASEEDINACITYMTNNYSESLNSNETMDAFCRGTGELDYSTMESWAKYYFTEEDNRFFKEHHLILEYQNDTPYDWVNQRTVLTTSEWNSIQNTSLSFKVKVEANEGIWVSEQGNSMRNTNSSSDGPFYQQKSDIKEVYFNKMSVDEMHQRYEEATYKADLTFNGEGEVLAWLETNSEDSSKYTMIVASDGKTDFPSNSNSLMYNTNVVNAEKVVFNNVNTSKVTNMNYFFAYCNGLKSVDLSSFDTGNVTDMRYMFYSASTLEYVKMSNLDMQKVKQTRSMFSGCDKLTEIDLSNSKMRDIEDMYYTFGSSKIETINLDGMGGDNLKYFDSVFPNTIKHISMKNFNFGMVEGRWFSGLTNLEDVDISGSKASPGYMNPGSLNSIFAGDSNLISVNLDGFETNSIIKSTDSMFSGCTSLTSVDLSSLDLSGVEKTGDMFNNCSSLVTIKVADNIDFSNVTYSDRMFNNCTSLVGGQGTAFDENNPNDETYAKIDGGQSNPGYFTLKTN